MKKTIIYSILAAFTLLTACRKSDNPNIPSLVRIPVPLITKDAAGDGTISNDDPAAFKGKFVVDVYFKNEEKPSKFDVVVMKNGNKGKVLHLKDGVTTFPTTVDVTGAELITLFGEPIVLGDKFTIGVNVTTKSGQIYEAFPAAGIPYGSGLTTMAGASTQIDYISVCPFDINDFVGSATIEDEDFWEDTYPVTVTLVGTDTYKIDDYIQTPGYSFLVKVNAATQTVTIAKQVYGAKLTGTSYTNPAIEGSGVIDACSHQIVMTVTHTVTQGSFGTVTIYLKK